MEYSHLDKVDFDKLYKAFIGAFSDYKIPLKLSPEDFRIRFFNKLKVLPKYSVAALNPGGDIVGFIFHSISTYEDIPTIYNGGTGVIPSYRRKGIASSMYEWIMRNLLNTNAQRIILEVISDNKGAINLYKDLGFTYKQTFRCFGLTQSMTQLNNNYQLIRSNFWEPEKYKHLMLYKPSFIDSDEQVCHNWINEILIEARYGDVIKGFVIFQPKLGRITQLGIGSSPDAAQALLSQVSLLSERKKITILNIPDEDTAMIDFLEEFGFRNEIDQFEMEMIV